MIYSNKEVEYESEDKQEEEGSSIGWAGALSYCKVNKKREEKKRGEKKKKEQIKSSNSIRRENKKERERERGSTISSGLC